MFTLCSLRYCSNHWDIPTPDQTICYLQRCKVECFIFISFSIFFSCQRGHFNSMVVVLNVKKYGDNSNSKQLCSSFNCIRIPGTSPTTGPRSGRTTVLPTTKHDEDSSDFFTHWSKCRVLWIANALWTAGSSGDECGGGANRQLLYSVVHNSDT